MFPSHTAAPASPSLRFRQCNAIPAGHLQYQDARPMPPLCSSLLRSAPPIPCRIRSAAPEYNRCSLPLFVTFRFFLQKYLSDESIKRKGQFFKCFFPVFFIKHQKISIFFLFCLLQMGKAGYILQTAKVRKCQRKVITQNEICYFQ